MRNEKHFLVKQISDMIGNADYVYFISFAGLTVKDFSELRNQLAAQNAVCHVLKNTLIRKAGEALKIEGLETIDFTQGTALVAGKGDCSAAAKVLAEFGKKNDKVAAKGGYMDGACFRPPRSEVWLNCRRSPCFRRCCSVCFRLRRGIWSPFSTPRLRAS